MAYMKLTRYPASLMLGVVAVVSLVIGIIGGVCGETFAEQTFAAAATPIILVALGLVIDRVVVERSKQSTVTTSQNMVPLVKH